MSEFLNTEIVPRMPPMSMAMIEEIGEKALAELYPEALKRPTAIDFLDLVERVLPQYGSGCATGALMGTSASAAVTTSSMVQGFSASPAAMAGVVRSVPWTLQKL